MEIRKDKNRKRRSVTRFGAFFLALNMCFWLLPVGLITANAEDGVFITEITLMQGDMGTLLLEESGYNIIEQPLNPSGTTELYLGYKTGGEGSAIRDLMVSTSGSGTIEVDGHSYQRVSNLSLNEGAGGSVMYLYASHDADAGEALRGISFLVKSTPDGFSNDSPVLASDGSEVVTTDDGKAIDFDKGIGESELYLRMYKGNLYRPYVERVVVATAGSEEAAIAELAGKRCTYYVNYDIGDEKSVYVGYTRTDDEKKALRALVAIGAKVDGDSAAEDADADLQIRGIPYTTVEGGKVKTDRNYTFYMTTDERAGEPVIDLIACGYAPEELGLKDLSKDKEAEEEETEEEEEQEEGEEAEEPVESEEEPEGSDASPEEEEEPKDADDGSGDDDAGGGEPKDPQDEEPVEEPEEPADVGGEEDVVSSRSVNTRALGMLCLAGLSVDGPASGGSVDEAPDAEEPDTEEPEESTKAEEPAEDDGEVKLAAAYRLYSEIEMKDWVSGYFLRGGGQKASKYLYEESAFGSAAESDEVLWISNMYCSDGKGKQFTNCIGYVTRPGEAEADPFEQTIAYDKAEEEAESTASVFGVGIGTMMITGMIAVILVGIIVSLAYKMRKQGD